MDLLNRRRVLVATLALLPVPAFFLSLFLGSYRIPPAEIFFMLATKMVNPFTQSPWPEVYGVVLFDIRLPRVILAMLVGLALAVSGASLQAIFRNPLVDTCILGISSGAAFGAAITLAFLPEIAVQPMAFFFGLLAVMLAYSMAKVRGEVSTVSLILAGIIVTAFFSAMVSLVKFLVTDPHQLAGIVYWLMGSLSLASWKYVVQVSPLILCGSLFLFLMRWRLNILSMGEEAKLLGVDVNRERFLVIVATAVITAAAVSVAGIIGWVGLIIPHIIRMAVGADNKVLIPLSMSVGAAFLLLADDLARSLTSYEIPVGIITTLGGAPFFIYLLRKTGGGGWR
ncbi:MAG: iron ABC transporter permease [Candidatus Verstraetearchaeota archaeon]|nr:iron ABC transporter permease [Candidatus Verstraetearchaeota archaeon]